MLRKNSCGEKISSLALGSALLLALALSGAACNQNGGGNSNTNGVTNASERMEGLPSGIGSAAATGREMTYQEPALTEVDTIVSNTNPTSLVSRPVNLSQVKVQRVLSDQYLVVGPDNDHTVLVRLEKSRPGLKAGETVNVSGVIAQLGEDLARWNLDPENKKIAARYSIFVNAISGDQTGATK